MLVKKKKSFIRHSNTSLLSIIKRWPFVKISDKCSLALYCLRKLSLKKDSPKKLLVEFQKESPRECKYHSQDNVIFK